MLVLMGQERGGQSSRRPGSCFIWRAPLDRNINIAVHPSSKYSSCLSSQPAARVMLRLETGSSSSQVIHQPRGRIMGLLRLTRDLPTVIQMRRLAGGRWGRGRLLLSHWSACHYHVWSLASTTEDRGQWRKLVQCHLTIWLSDLTNSSTDFLKYCLK